MLLPSTTSTPTHLLKTVKPLFTLQHSSASKSNKGNNVTSLCFLHRNHAHTSTDYGAPLDSYSNDDEEGESSTDDDDDDDELLLEFKSHRLLSSSSTGKSTTLSLAAPNHALPQHLSAINQATSLSFENTLLASTHVNGLACIWDLTKRRVVKTLDDDPMGTIRSGTAVPGQGQGPGLALGNVNNRYFFHQRRDRNGTVTIYDEEFNAVQRFQCHSQTFCQASSNSTVTGVGSGISASASNTLIITPSKHESFAQLWDIRMGGNRDGTKSIGVIHGAKLHREDVSKWRDEGMLTSLTLSTWSNGHAFIGCGMESGKVFVHDLRMMGTGRNTNTNTNTNTETTIPNDDASSSYSSSPSRFIVTDDDVIETEVCSVTLGQSPTLCLDMCPSHDEKSVGTTDSSIRIDDDTELKRDQRSVIMIAGQAADAKELMAKSKEERGTVSVIKATSRISCHGVHDGGIQARVRTSVGTCKLSDKIAREGKPGVGVCRFRPEGKVFAVGGWDKRVRIYSRTSAKELAVLRGLNDQSISALDWVRGDDRLMQQGVLAAGSDDGKIALWSAFSL